MDLTGVHTACKTKEPGSVQIGGGDEVAGEERDRWAGEEKS